MGPTERFCVVLIPESVIETRGGLSLTVTPSADLADEQPSGAQLNLPFGWADDPPFAGFNPWTGAGGILKAGIGVTIGLGPHGAVTVSGLDLPDANEAGDFGPTNPQKDKNDLPPFHVANLPGDPGYRTSQAIDTPPRQPKQTGKTGDGDQGDSSDSDTNNNDEPFDWVLSHILPDEPDQPPGDYPTPPTDTAAAFDPENDTYSTVPAAVARFMNLIGIGPASDDPEGDYSGSTFPGFHDPRGPLAFDPEAGGDASGQGTGGHPGGFVIRDPRGPGVLPNPEGGGPQGPAAAIALIFRGVG